ncbi:hypothetical protein OS493_018377 [Desmophyllum pertusum]|uniref:Uncharacterized protein n=1 Tax=Desmophyllum pertusum TaxID=174260 RepID=A0A9W9YC38_9CNID|nr:hypothetical protein OS493_018377 [Desmophyllum pertusum]
MIFSPWTDLKDEYAFYFSIIGRYRRFFYISKPDATCSGDDGWLMSTATPGCAYESRFPRTTVLYSKLQTSSKWSVYGANDSFTAFFRSYWHGISVEDFDYLESASLLHAQEPRRERPH